MLGVSVRGFERLDILFDRIEEAVDPELVLDEAGAILLNRIRSRFLKQVDPDGRPWIQSRAAIRRREKTGREGTLFDKGNLFRSIQLANRGPLTRGVFTDIPYGRKHQEGLDGMDKRVFLGFGGTDSTIIEKLLVNRLNRARK